MKTLLLTAASLVLATCLPVYAASARPYIFCDDLGYGDVRCLNALGKIATPNMARIAIGGLKFTDADSSSAVCPPTQYNVPTDRYNWRSRIKIGVLNGYSPRLIESGRTTVADPQKNQGYPTACIGKWLRGMNWPQNDGAAAGATDNPKKIDYTRTLENGPTALSFDYFHGISASLDMVPYVFNENDHVTELPTVEKQWIRGGLAVVNVRAERTSMALPAAACATHPDPSNQGMTGKKQSQRDGHRIPFLVRWPGHVKLGSTSDQLVCLVDFFATCAGILEKKPPDTMAEDSVSRRPVLEGTTAQPIHEDAIHHSIKGAFAVRQGNWKREFCTGSGGWSDPKPGAPEAANLPPILPCDFSSDICETRNLQAEPPEIVAKLTKTSGKYIADARSTPVATQTTSGPVEIHQKPQPPKQLKNDGAGEGAVPVTVSAKDGMTRGGKPYFVKGAGGETQLDLLAQRGANSIRTWSTSEFDVTLEQAAALDLTVSAGIWLESECSWFSYKNPTQCAKQLARVRAEVMKYRNHPALLAWGIGNESEGDGTSDAYWQQLDRLAVMVKEIDPAHPTFTAVAGMGILKSKGLNEYAPHLDYVGINTYGGLFSLRNHLKQIGWNRPWLITEWGPQGYWERPKNTSGAPLEQTSSEKAAMMRRAYDEVISQDGACLGSYAFVWGWKFEASATWFGLLTHDGKTTEPLDVLQEKWSGSPPANRAPSILPMKGVPSEPVHPGSLFSVQSGAADPEGDALSWQWAVLPEKPASVDGKPTAMPVPIEGIIVSSETSRAELKAPAKPGSYRLYLWVSDDKDHAATVNAPFEVK